MPSIKFVFMRLLFYFFLVVQTTLALPSVPEPPRGRPKTIDCNGIVAFSAVTSSGGKTRNKPISFETMLLAKSTGYSSQSGVFTAPCPGLYQFSFSGSGDNLKLSLRRRPSSATSSWTTIVETGSKGGSQTVLLMVEVGEDLAVFPDTGTPSSTRSLTFSGVKLATK